MSLFRRDPGDCPVCGQPHAACTAGDRKTAIAVAQLPARDRALGSSSDHDAVLARARQTHPNAVSTKTYRRERKRR